MWSATARWMPVWRGMPRIMMLAGGLVIEGRHLARRHRRIRAPGGDKDEECAKAGLEQ